MPAAVQAQNSPGTPSRRLPRLPCPEVRSARWRGAAPPPSRLTELAQDVVGVLAEERGGAGGRHRLAVDHDRRAQPWNGTALGGRARPLDAHAAMDHLRVGEYLVEVVDRSGRDADRFEPGEEIGARRL